LKKKREASKLAFRAERIRELTPEKLPAVVGGALSPGGSGSTETENKIIGP
jgi:hypothetical protein